jgi:hypothetical protein
MKNKILAMTAILAITQHGEKVILNGKHPRKELLEHFNYTSAQKMFVDTIKGEFKHVGYVITHKGYSTLWCTLYNLTEWKNGE